MKKLTLTAILVSLALGCAQPPPNLSPAGVAAFKGTQVIKALDMLRDVAIDAHATVPPLLAETTTRSVVLYHKSAITIIHSTPNGWAPSVQAGLAELSKTLAASERAQLVPYITLAQTLIAEVTR